MIALAAWAWILGVVGLGGAVLFQLLPGGSTPADRAAAALAALGRAFRLFFRREYLVLVVFLVIGAGLLGWATSILTGVAFFSGGLFAAAAGYWGVSAATRGLARVAAAAGEGGARPFGAAFSTGSVPGLALASLALLGVGGWYALRGAGAITDPDFQTFAGILAGFALGVVGAALFVRVAGAVHVGGRAFAGGPGLAGGSPAFSLADAGAGLLADVGGTATDVFGSLAASVVGSIALGAGVPQYASSRLQAAALPVLLVADVVVAGFIGAGLERALRRGAAAGRPRLLGLVATIVFLGLAYGIVKGLGFEIVDPTGARAFRPDAPFLALLFGTVAALIAGISGGLAFGRDEAANGGPAGPRPALSLGAAVVPLIVVALAAWAGYFLAGLYGLAIAAIGLNGTVAASYGLSALAPMLEGGAAVASEAGVDRDAVATAERVRGLVGPVDAMARPMVVAGAGLAALAALSGYASLVGLPEGTLDLLDAPVLLGLMIGVALPYGFAASIVGSMRRAARAGLAAEPFRGRAGGDVAALGGSTPISLLGTVVPVLLAIVLPILLGLLSLTMLGGLVAGTVLTAFVLAEAMTRGDRLLAAAAPVLGSLAKAVALVALVLCSWLAATHGIGLSATSLGAGAHRLLAFLGG